ncbi:MAG: FkbM family methyltransferase [Acidimicrobiales bacterium]
MARAAALAPPVRLEERRLLASSTASDSARALDALLSQDPSTVARRIGALWDGVAGDAAERVVLHGTRQVGLDTLESLRRAGVEPLAFSDNDPSRWFGVLDGIPVLPPALAVERFGSCAVFVAALFHTEGVLRQLRDLGARRVAPWTWLYSGRPEWFLPYWGLDLPDGLLADRERVAEAAGLWADEESLRVLVEQVRWRTTIDASVLRPPSPACDTHFDPSLVRLGQAEVLVDCGAFDGDSFQRFVEVVGGSFRRAHLVEADPENVARLGRRLAAMPAEIRSAVVVHPVAAGREVGRVPFASTGSVSSSIQPGGETTVACVPLDELVLRGEAPQEAPTLVKVDVEGAELDLLSGARRLLSEGSALWSIMAYHRPADLWEIPLHLHEHGDHDLYLRRYAEDCWETCIYAIPRRRRPA